MLHPSCTVALTTCKSVHSHFGDVLQLLFHPHAPMPPGPMIWPRPEALSSSICPTAEDKPSSVMTSMRGLRSSTSSRLRWASRALRCRAGHGDVSKMVESCHSDDNSLPKWSAFWGFIHIHPILTRGVRFANADLTQFALNSVQLLIQEDQCLKISNYQLYKIYEL